MSHFEALYEGVVTNNNDPDKLGRVKATVRGLTAAGVDFPGWISPAGQFSSPNSETGTSSGSLWIPEQGSVVLVQVLESTSYDRRTPREAMVGAPKARYYHAPYSTAAPPPAELTGASYPFIRGFVTPGGHVLTFDDGLKEILIKRADGPQYVKMDADGNTVVHATIVKIDEGADAHLVRWEDLKSYLDLHINTYYNTHTHLSPVGPTGPPLIPGQAVPDSVGSTSHMVK